VFREAPPAGPSDRQQRLVLTSQGIDKNLAKRFDVQDGLGVGLATMAISEHDRARLTELGEARVRLQVTTNGFGHPFHSSALQWLAELDEAARARSDASQVAQMRTALSASRAAWIAAIAAIVAAAIIGSRANSRSISTAANRAAAAAKFRIPAIA
jgi:hypothetical protein